MVIRYTTDDVFVRTHEEARDLIAQCAGGLRVRFAKPATATERSARFELFHGAHPRRALAVADVYSLPFKPGPVARRVRDLAARAAAELKS